MIDTRPLTAYSDATILHWLERSVIIEAYEHSARLRDEALKRGLIELAEAKIKETFKED